MPAEPKSYLAVDIARDGKATVDRFTASNDTAAARRAKFAAEGVALELWRDEQLLGRWVRMAGRTFAWANSDQGGVAGEASSAG